MVKRAQLSEDEIDSDDNDDILSKKQKVQIEIDETPQEKKLRLAKEYINQIKSQEGDVEENIQDDALDKAGKLFKASAETTKKFLEEKKFLFRCCKNGHSRSPTAVEFAPDGNSVYSGGKDGTVLKWDIRNLKSMRRINTRLGGKKDATDFVGHTSAVLALAVSSDGLYVATGDQNGKIIIWNQSLELVHKFSDHKKAVTGLVFRKQTSQLYSCSVDRTAKVFDLESKSYIETLFGHQDAIQAIDANIRERCITAGGRDNTIRVFKIPEESQLIYRGHHGSIDCIGLLNDEFFVSAGDDAAINFWTSKRKKPIAVVRNAHQGQWVTAIGTALNSDSFVSGSSDGFLRFWRVTADKSRIEQYHAWPLDGIVNSIKISDDHKTIAVAVGQENRTGRWNVNKKIRNGIYVIKLNQRNEVESSSSEEDSSSSEENISSDEEMK